MLSSRWTGGLLMAAAAAAALAGGDPGLLVVAAVAVGVVVGAARLGRGRARGRRAAAAAGGGGYWPARLPAAAVLQVWPAAPQRLSLYGPVRVTITADPAGVTITPARAATWFAGLRPRRLAWSEISAARRATAVPGAAASGTVRSAGPPAGRGGVLLEWQAGAVLLYADDPDALVRFVAERACSR